MLLFAFSEVSHLNLSLTHFNYTFVNGVMQNCSPLTLKAKTFISHHPSDSTSSANCVRNWKPSHQTWFLFLLLASWTSYPQPPWSSMAPYDWFPADGIWVAKMCTLPSSAPENTHASGTSCFSLHWPELVDWGGQRPHVEDVFNYIFEESHLPTRASHEVELNSHFVKTGWSLSLVQQLASQLSEITDLVKCIVTYGINQVAMYARVRSWISGFYIELYLLPVSNNTLSLLV